MVDVNIVVTTQQVVITVSVIKAMDETVTTTLVEVVVMEGHYDNIMVIIIL